MAILVAIPVAIYELYRASSSTAAGIKVYEGTYTSYKDFDGMAGRTYYYYIIVYNGNAASPQSARKKIN